LLPELRGLSVRDVDQDTNDALDPANERLDDAAAIENPMDRSIVSAHDAKFKLVFLPPGVDNLLHGRFSASPIV
jgi:hypothetical protein